MQPRIETLIEKRLIGKRMKMSFSNNKTGQLWQSFMPRRKEIKNNVSSELFSVEVYPSSFFNDFTPEKEFDKWAAIEVSNYDSIPSEMETLTIPSGMYAVFLHKGPASEGHKTYQDIFETWLPNSDFLIDNRPHIAIMGEKYKGSDPSSEEEIWIPINKIK
jgi:AraC family transcriptional regulator